MSKKEQPTSFGLKSEDVDIKMKGTMPKDFAMGKGTMIVIEGNKIIFPSMGLVVDMSTNSFSSEKIGETNKGII